MHVQTRCAHSSVMLQTQDGSSIDRCIIYTLAIRNQCSSISEGFLVGKVLSALGFLFVLLCLF